MRRFVIGDIHGAHKALIQCFERSGFDKNNDLLICLGDLCDGWPDCDQVFSELLSVKNLVTVLGNHDQWLLNWLRTGEAPGVWLSQGGNRTLLSLGIAPPESYRILLENSKFYHKEDNFLFVHGGILTDRPLEKQGEDIFLWDRSLVRSALYESENEISLTVYDIVFVGHTPTINFGPPEPIIRKGVCLLDTGAGWPGGKLSIMNVDDISYFQSDQVNDLYPYIKIR